MSRILIFGLLIFTHWASAQKTSSPPSVLVVMAHPDDETMFSATLFRITQSLEGTVDIAVMTDGAGGYRYATLSESIYGRDLTDPEVAKNFLPAIRKKELIASGEIAGVRNYFFHDQPDQGVTEDQDSILSFVWDRKFVEERLGHILAKGDYDFVFTHLPIKPFHAHHKSATILAIEAVYRMPPDERPIIMGGFTSRINDEAVASFSQLEGYPLTKIFEGGPFIFDRATTFGLDDRLNYSIIYNWMVGEYKSQGVQQMFMDDPAEPAVEQYWVFEMNGRDAIVRAEALLRLVRSAPF